MRHSNDRYYIDESLFKQPQLLIKTISNIKSDDFKNAVSLGDSNSKTLGFLPYVAFEKYAKDGQLIGAFHEESGKLMGYLLYRISYNKVTIVHCCIDENQRNKKVALNLVNFLKKNTKQYEGIKLSCRNDYGIDHVWERFKFVPVKEKTGRSKEGLPLTVWWYPHKQNDLFSQMSDYELSNKIIAVIDMNVFLDIKNAREKESLALKSDWILSEAILYFTREIHIEINRAKNSKDKESSRSLLSYFKELPFKDEDDFSLIFKELVDQFPTKNNNDRSDLNHLAYSISSGAQFFITRDEEIIKNRDFFLRYNLIINRPSEFITELDENIQASKYKPQRLIGTSISSKRITKENIDFYTKIFLRPGEKKSHLQKIIRDSLSAPDKYELTTISKNEELLAFIIFDRTSESKLKVPIFRLLVGNLKNTLSKHLLYRAILASVNEDRQQTEITEQYLESEIIDTIKEARFLEIGSSWKKINIKGVYNEDDLLERLITLNKVSSDHIEILNCVRSITYVDEFSKKYNIERFLFPLKIEELDIPTYIIPIKPQWAEQLFNDKSDEKLNLFEPEYELLLNRQNVYYRSAMPKVIHAPARILWYISENKLTKGKGEIKASSYIDEIFIDEPKKLYKQFEQLGVYKWKHIADAVGNKNQIMAFVFSDTELFKNTISLNTVSQLIKKMENKNFMAVTPIKIKPETYLALYKLGIKR